MLSCANVKVCCVREQMIIVGWIMWSIRTHVKKLFMGYSFAFNTILPKKLITNIQDLVLNTS